jgi:hypothetical protein
LLGIFHPKEFYGMNDEMTLKIASEDEDIRQRRVKLKKQRGAIIDSLRACDDLPFRHDIGQVSTDANILAATSHSNSAL